jgi:integrase
MLPVRSLTAAHLLPIVQRVEKRGAETVAILIRQACSQIFRYAIATLRADMDHAAALKGAIERPAVKHKQPLTKSEIPVFLQASNDYSGSLLTAIALRLLLLTFVRPAELRGAEWAEFDLDSGLWRIPAGRMKMRTEHLVPLSSQALDLLREVHTLTGEKRWLFPNARRPLTFMGATTLNAALTRMGYGGRFSAHGFRTTASTLLNELGFDSDVIERQLAHQDRNSIRATYNQAQYLEQRRAMMQAWSDFALQVSPKVVPGKFGRAA